VSSPPVLIPVSAAASATEKLSQATNLEVAPIAYDSISLQQLKTQTTTVVSRETAMVSKETEAAETLLKLMQAPKIPEKSDKKRERDPSSGSGGSAQKKTRGNDDDDDDDQDIGSISSSQINMDAVMDRLSMAEREGKINTNSFKRLQMLQRLLNECERDELITIKIMKSKESKETIETKESKETIETKENKESKETKETKESKEIKETKVTNEINKCILGWSKLSVKEPKKFHKKILDMIVQDQTGIWKKANQTLKNPTLAVYELFRKIGVKPRFRGPIDEDPGKKDLFYYLEWEFKNGESFENARQRLVKGFDYRKKPPSLQEEDD
jgi:hypothetical protein